MNTKVGTLTDKNIKELCKDGKVISENFNDKLVKQSCYELRASTIYYDVTVSDRKIELKENEYILIKPKQLVVIMTLEVLDLPSDMLGRILTKGKLFSVGLLPVNTYADPGFSGKLGIVFSNLSNNYIKIKPNEAIAKIEFSKLESPVEKPYSGQHGYETGIWPVPRDMILTEEEIKKDKRIGSVSDEIILSHGTNVGRVIEKINNHGKKLIISTIAYITFTLILIGVLQGTDWLSPLITIFLGVISNILYTIVVWITTNFKR